MLNGIFWVLRSGAPWRDLPERYGDRLVMRREEDFKRGQIKVETDECFMEWDTNRCLAELRSALLEETLLDE